MTNAPGNHNLEMLRALFPVRIIVYSGLLPERTPRTDGGQRFLEFGWSALIFVKSKFRNF